MGRNRPTASGVAEAIHPLQLAAVLDGDTFHSSHVRGDVTQAGGPDADGAYMHPCRLEWRGHHGPHQVTRSIAPYHTRPPGFPRGEAPLGDMLHLPLVPPQCADLQWFHGLPANLLRGTRANHHSIEPMRLGHTPLQAVPLGEPATACLHRKPEGYESMEKGLARTVHRCRIAQGGFGVCLHLGMPTLRCCLCALPLIARMAGRR